MTYACSFYSSKYGNRVKHSERRSSCSRRQPQQPSTLPQAPSPESKALHPTLPITAYSLLIHHVGTRGNLRRRQPNQMPAHLPRAAPRPSPPPPPPHHHKPPHQQPPSARRRRRTHQPGQLLAQHDAQTRHAPRPLPRNAPGGASERRDGPRSKRSWLRRKEERKKEELNWQAETLMPCAGDSNADDDPILPDPGSATPTRSTVDASAAPGERQRLVGRRSVRRVTGFPALSRGPSMVWRATSRARSDGAGRRRYVSCRFARCHGY